MDSSLPAGFDRGTPVDASQSPKRLVLISDEVGDSLRDAKTNELIAIVSPHHPALGQTFLAPEAMKAALQAVLDWDDGDRGSNTVSPPLDLVRAALDLANATKATH